MFSEALAGVLKVGAVGLTTAGLSASVYFLVQVSDAEDAASRTRPPPGERDGSGHANLRSSATPA